MAYQTSNEYKSLIYDEDSIQEIDILINDIIIDCDYIKKLTYKDNIFENDYFSLGSTITSQIELECDNDILELYPNGINEIEVKFKLEISEDTYEVIPFKKYILKSQSNVKDRYTKFVFQDYMSKFNDVEFDFSGEIPITRYNLLKRICEHCNIELENNSIVNGDIMVGVYDDSIPVKTWISCIAERSGAFAKITRDNKLVIKSFNNLDSITLPDELVGDYKTNEKKIITKVVYENGVPELYEQGTDEGETIFLNSDSPFACSQGEVDAIYEVLNGLEYQSLECKIWGDPSIDTGDILIFNGIKSFAQMNWNFGNGFYGSYKTQLEKIGKNAHVERIPTSVRIKKISSQINELDGKVTTTIEETDELSSRVTSIEQTSENFNIDIINQKIQESNNNLQNEINTTNANLQQSNSKIDTLAGTIENMNFNFSTAGLTIGSLGVDINSTLNNQGLKIYNLNTLIAIFNKNGAGVDKLIVTKSIQLQNILLKKRQITRPDTNETIDVVSCFWLENLIESLEDLEV